MRFKRAPQSHLPLLDVLPHVFELMEAQFSRAVTLEGLELKALTCKRGFKHHEPTEAKHWGKNKNTMQLVCIQKYSTTLKDKRYELYAATTFIQYKQSWPAIIVSLHCWLSTK